VLLGGAGFGLGDWRLVAAARGLGVTRLGLWEPPYFLDDEATRPPADHHARRATAVAAGRPGDAVELFFTAVVGMPAEFVAQMRQARRLPRPDRPAGQGQRADTGAGRRGNAVDAPHR